MQTDIQMRGRNHHRNTQGEELPLLGVLGSQRAREVPDGTGKGRWVPAQQRARASQVPVGGSGREARRRPVCWQPCFTRAVVTRVLHRFTGIQSLSPRSPAPWSRVRISAAAAGCLPHVVPTGHEKAARALRRHEGAGLTLGLTADSAPVFSVRAAGRQHLTLCTRPCWLSVASLCSSFVLRTWALSPLEIWWTSLCSMSTYLLSKGRYP